MMKMLNHPAWRKGQIILVMSITLIAVILAVSTMIYLTSMQHLFFSYNPSREIILSIDSDFQRALTRILANATAHYNITAEMNTPRMIANKTFSYWVLSTQAAYTGKGLNIETQWVDEPIQGGKTMTLWVEGEPHEQTYTERRLQDRLFKLFWYRPNSISAIGADISIDATDKGIIGWRATHIVLLNLTITSIWPDKTEDALYLNVVVLREGEKPVNDLKAENFVIYLFDPTVPLGTYWWRRTSSDQMLITYNGGGNYTIKIVPQFYDPGSSKKNSFWEWGSEPGYYQFMIVRVKDNRDIIVEAYSYAGIEYVIQERAVELYYSDNPSKTKEKYVFELLPNGTMYWYNEALPSPYDYPIPLPPIKQIRVLSTVNGESDPNFEEVPYQIEIWEDRYLWPNDAEFLNWRQRFMNGSKLVFQVNYPLGVDKQRVRLTWLEDADTNPPEYRMKMFISHGYARVDTGSYIFWLIIDNDVYAQFIGQGHVDWSFSIRNKENSSWVDFFLLGYNASRPQNTDSSPCYLPNKMIGGNWTILPKPEQEGGVLVSKAPVRIVAYRKSDIVETKPAPGMGGAGQPSPGPDEIEGVLHHESIIYLPYNVSYFLLTENATWLQDVEMDEYRTYLALIGIIGPPLGSDPNRVQWGSLMTYNERTVNGTFSNIDGTYIDHRGRGWGMSFGTSDPDTFLVNSGLDYRYWAALYRDGFGVCLFASESLIQELGQYGQGANRRDRLWVWTNPLGARRIMEYDAIGWDQQVKKKYKFEEGNVISFKAAGFLLEGGKAANPFPDDDKWYDDDDTNARPFGIVNDPAVIVPEELVLAKRNAFIYDDFLTDPFAAGKLTANTGAWSWNPAGYIQVSADGPSGGYGGMHVAYYSTTIPPGTSTVYVLSKERHATTASGQHVGLTMIESGNRLDTLEFYRDPNRRLGIWRYSATWSYITRRTQNLADNTWFIFLGERNLGSGAMRLTVYNSGGAQQGNTLSATDTSISVSRVGLGIRDEALDGGSLSASFDDFVACIVDPRFVNVTGLSPGWFIVLKDSGGAVIAQGTADSRGVASLNVMTRPIIRNGRLEVYGSKAAFDIGEEPIISESFDFIVGGDVYNHLGTSIASIDAVDESMMYYRMFLDSYVPIIIQVSPVYESG